MVKHYSKYLSFVLEHKWLLALLTLTIVAFGFPTLNVKINNNMEEWFPSTSPQLVAKSEYIKDFGNDEVIFVLLTFPEEDSIDVRLRILDSLTVRLEKIGGLDQVLQRSQLSLPAVMGVQARLKRLEKLFFEAKNPQSEMIYLRPSMVENFDAYRPLLLDSVSQVLKPLDDRIRVDLTGSGVVFTRVEELTKSDSALLFGLCFGLVFAVLAWRLKNIGRIGMAILLFCLLFWPAISMFAWLGISVSLITMVVPILLVINFFAYILHLSQGRKRGTSDFLKEKLPPIIFSAITTMIGFGSLMLSEIQVIQQFGLLTFLGILVGLLSLLLVGIPILCLRPYVQEKNSYETQFLKPFFNSLNRNRSFQLVLFALGLVLVGIWSGRQIEVDTNSINFLPSSDTLRKSTTFIQDHFGAFNTVDFLVSRSDLIELEAEDFRLLRKLEKRVGELDFVNGVVSFNTWRPIVRFMTSMDTSMSQRLSLGYLTEDKKRSRMSLRIPLGSVQAMKNDLEKIEIEIDEVLGENELRVKAVGYLPIYIEHTDQIVGGMIRSLGLAVLLIGLAMILMVGDLKLGLIALIPNTFPLFGLAIFMFVAQIPLNIATSIIASVVIGIVVDDTLHIIWSYKKEKEKGGKLSLQKVMEGILIPSTTTSLMFVLGFMVLIASGLSSLHDFGLLVSLAIALGWIGDFVIFPAFLYLLGRGEA